MDIHPLLAAMPTGSERDYEILRDDIDRNGLVEPIKTWKDVVTDGRQRLRACQETGQEVRTAREWGDDEDNASEEEVVERILQRNLKRAHWTTGQKAAAVLEVALWRHRQAAAARQAAGGRPNLDEGQAQGRAMELAAKQYGVSAASCYLLRRIKEADTATYGEVKAGLRTPLTARTASWSAGSWCLGASPAAIGRSRTSRVRMSASRVRAMTAQVT